MTKGTEGYILVPVEAISADVCEDCDDFELETALEMCSEGTDDRIYRCAHVERCRALVERCRRLMREEGEHGSENCGGR